MEEAREIRQALGRLRSRSPRRRVPTELRERVVAYARARRSEGASWYRVSLEVGCTSATIQRWGSSRGSEKVCPIVPVEILTEASGVPGLLALVSPAGYRLEGLELHQAADLLRRLG
jgi:hypothetical protein